jgi:hypothetical protein
MVLGIKEYPVDIDTTGLVEFVDTLAYADLPHVTKTEDDFLEYDTPVIKKLRWSFYDACSRYWGMDVFDFNINAWIYVDWKENKNAPYMHAHELENPYRLSGIMYLTLPGDSGTTMFPMPRRDPYFLPKKLFTWFIFPSNLPHLPGKCDEEEKRYCLSADLYA